MHPKVQEAINSILEEFKSGRIAESITMTHFMSIAVPMSNWSMCNRLLATLARTYDARGYRQWESIGRHPKKGTKAFYIFAPRFIKKKADDKEDKVLKGYLAVAVFRKEDTEGDELVYPDIKKPDIHPIITERAKEWGISISIEPYRGYLGYYTPSKDAIVLCTDDEATAFHELAHVAQDVFKKNKGQEQTKEERFKEEISAELTAAVLCRFYGRETSKGFSFSYKYISDYASKMKLSPQTACMSVLWEVDALINLIIGTDTRAVH